MFCTKCGTELRTADKFCFDCGAATLNAYGTAYGTQCGPALPLSRPVHERKIAGVCAGFARYLGIDVTLARIIALILLLWPVPFIGGLAYLFAWMVMPQDPVAATFPSAHPTPSV
jgi:phage shock protein C